MFSHPCYCHFIGIKQCDSLHCSERRDDPKIIVLFMPTVPSWDSGVSFLKIYSQLLNKQPNSQKCWSSHIPVYKSGFSLTIKSARVIFEVEVMGNEGSPWLRACKCNTFLRQGYTLNTDLQHSCAFVPMTDVTFKLEDGSIKAHKPLLICSCEWMSAMFGGSFIESSNTEVFVYFCLFCLQCLMDLG